MENLYYPFINYPLPYDYAALEPYIDAKTMRLHHDKHLQTYVDNLNNSLKDYPGLQKWPLVQLIYNSRKLPEKIGTPIHNNAGGVYNHRFFFEGLTNQSNRSNAGKLGEVLIKQFGSYENFKEEFKKAALSVFGSGYTWLVSDKGRLRIVTTPNQNNPIEDLFCPILTLDVWEHAYYLKYYNVRAEYIDNYFNIINWKKAELNYLDCIK